MKKILGLLASLVLAFAVVTPANASTETTQFGTFGTATHSCNGITLQGLYTNDLYQGNVSVRASGGGGYWSNGYLRELHITERWGGTLYGHRDIYYTGQAKSVSVSGVGTNYLPWMRNFYQNDTTMGVQIVTTQTSCYWAFIIGN